MTSDERRLVVAVALLVLFGSAIRLAGVRAPRVSEERERIASAERSAAVATSEPRPAAAPASGPETEPAKAPAEAEEPVAFEPVDLNSGDAAALETLPGIGPAKARRIIEWRGKHGPFRSLADLEEVPGIGKKTIARLAPLVVLTKGEGAPAAGTPAKGSGESDEPGPRGRPPAGAAPLPGPVPEGPEAEGVVGRPDR